MSHNVVLSNKVYDTLLKAAAHEGTTPAEWIAERLPGPEKDRGDQMEPNGTGEREGTAGQTCKSAWDVLDALTGTIDAPEDWSTEHDHYITGSPTRHKRA